MMIEKAYDLLRVDRNASPDDVRKAYIRLVRRYPPEHFPEKFAELQKAYQQFTLNDNFVTEMFQRIVDSDSSLSLAACLLGDRKELQSGWQFAPEELISLLEGEDARRAADEILTSVSDEIEWKNGGNE